MPVSSPIGGEAPSIRTELTTHEGLGSRMIFRAVVGAVVLFLTYKAATK